MSEPVHPLRITKNAGPMASPPKRNSALPRPLSEISPSEMRRNSPSWNHTSKKMGLNMDSSPFQSSPLDSTTSPRLFWQNRNGFGSENTYDGSRTGSPSPTRRSSIERLQKASRVKNSSILALEQKNEYDPTRLPRIERPLAKVQQNAYGGLGIVSPRTGHEGKGHQRTESKTNIPRYSPAKTSSTSSSLDSAEQVAHQPEPETNHQAAPPAETASPAEQPSPIKSSLANRFRSSYNEHGDSSTEYDPASCPSPQRNAKSVTFDAAPPQVNEYEMATPDLSSIGSNSREGSYDLDDDDDDYDDYHYFSSGGNGQEDSFDASLEDTDKTPVVGPDDWSHDSPSGRRGRMYDESPMPEVHPSSALGHDNVCNSSGSGGDHRPLPPLPGMMHARSQSDSSPALSATAERMVGGSLRGLPSPPAASTTKFEIQNIGNSKMPLEERLRLMMLSDDHKTAAELQRERRMRRAGPNRASSQTPERQTPERQTPERQTPEHETPEHEARTHHEEEDDAVGDLSALGEYQLPPRISRESILRRVNGGIGQDRESDYNFSSPAPSSSPERRLPLDPDVPIPSTEHDDDSILPDDSIQDEDAFDVCLPHNKHVDDGREDREESESAYSESCASQPGKDDDVSTPREKTPVFETASSHVVQEGDIHQPEVPTLALEGRLSMGESHLLNNAQTTEEPTPEPEQATAEAVAPLARPQTPEQKSMPKVLSKPEYDGTGWGDDEEYEEEPSTPDSVIHHPVHRDEEDDDVFEEEEVEEEEVEAPAVPEQLATIKASGSKLKTRPSATPSDIEAMRDARRHVSGEQPGVPPIPERHRNRLSRDMGADPVQQDESSGDNFLDRHPSFKNHGLTLDLDLGLSLDQDFDRVIEAQKVESYDYSIPTPTPMSRSTRFLPSPAREVSANNKCSDTGGSSQTTKQDLHDTNITSRKQRGYLMRQNTKLVAASDKHSEEFRGGARSAGNSPVKKDRPQSWTVEPWTADKRTKSQRKRSVPSGPAPPLPGQESNAAALNPLAEEETTPADGSTEEGAERGRLFVKVMGVKDLDLPIPRNERTWFSLTLDNGVHCVTTAWLEMARNAPIGQEFELLVPNELEFQLTLNVKLEKPVVRKVAPLPPVKLVRPKSSTFSRVFASPKKRKEMEQRFKEEEERQAREHQEAQAKMRNTRPTAYDLLSPLVAEDGSFARAYVCLKEHESRCYGRPAIVDVVCFNEWATEEAGFASSVKSKRGDGAVVRRAPYKIGKLELQLLFVPRPKNVSNDDMPKSMNSCIREMKAAEERQSRNWEGHLSQQGGDCPYWRRRYFKLVGTKLTAYHEATRQPRATINLGNAKRLIDDRRALMEKETTAKNGRRRRSGFAEEEEGYMFVEEGFRIRFNNGEVIDFYADSTADKEGWMKVLSDVISRDSMGNSDDDSARAKSKWCELVLKREEQLRRRSEGRRVHSRTKSTQN